MPELLEVRDLGMSFGGLKALEGISFSAADRQITAIIGPNGAGKTTLFNCLTGFYRPTTGVIILGDQHLEKLAGHRIAAVARVARTFQNIRLFPGMTALENLVVAQHNALRAAGGAGLRALFGLPGARAAERAAIDRAAHWLAATGLLPRADDPAGSLPYGAQRRLEIARALCTSPVLLCLDEPAAGLNPRESDELAALLLNIRQQGTAILLIEHDMRVVMRISDHIVVLDQGRKIAQGAPAAIRDDKAVIAAYLGEPEPALTC